MRKTSAYARKLKRIGGRYNGAEWLNVIQKCRSFDETEPIPGSWLEGTYETAERMEKKVRGSLSRLLSGQVAKDETEVFYHLHNAIGVAIVRADETKGDKSEASVDLWAAKTAINSVADRWNKLGKWGATRPEQIALEDGVEYYCAFLKSSSPAQMSEAARLWMEILKAQGWVEPDERKAA